MKPWEQSAKGKGVPWEAELVAPVSPQIPYTDPKTTIAQGTARDQFGAEERARQETIAATQEAYGPWEAGLTAMGNETVQPFLGAGMKASGLGATPNINRWLEGLSTGMEAHTQQLRDAYPVPTMAGQTVPYLATAPAAQGLYMKGVSKMAPGFARNTLARTLPSAMIPGAVEGGLIAAANPYQSGTQGAAIGAAGNVVGQMLTKPLSRGITNLDQYSKDMLGIAKDWKITGHPNKSVYDYMMPGARTGNIGFKEVDDAIATNSQARQAVSHRFNVPQQEINRKVLNVAGLDADVINPGDLYKHQRTLGKEYDKLERKSTPIFSDQTVAEVATARAAYDDLSGNLNPKWADNLQNKFNKIMEPDAFELVGPTPTGKALFGENSGAINLDAYRTMKNELKTIINRRSGYALDRTSLAEKSMAQDYLQILRDTMKRGTRDPKIISKWDTLDSKYAAARFLEDNKILESGQVDAKRLYRAMNSKMPGQLASFRGPWSDMAKAAHLGKYIEDARNTTLGMKSEVNTIMGSRANQRGIFGNLTRFGADTKWLPSAAVTRYAFANPKKGLLRLPQTAPLFGAGAVSGPFRGGLMDRDPPR